MRGSKAMIPAILLGLRVITVGCIPAAEEATSTEEITRSTLPGTPNRSDTHPEGDTSRM